MMNLSYPIFIDEIFGCSIEQPNISSDSDATIKIE